MKIRNLISLLFFAASFQAKSIDIIDLYKLIKENNLKAIQELKDFDWGQKTQLGRNPLMIAAALGKYEIVEYLASVSKKDFDVHDHDLNGTTTYMFAIWNGDRKIVNFLETFNVDKSEEDNNGEDYADYAQRNNSDIEIQILDDIEKTKEDIDNLEYNNKFLSASEFLSQFSDPKNNSLLSEATLVDDQFEKFNVVTEKEKQKKESSWNCVLM